MNNNLKWDVVNIFDEIDKGKYSNIHINNYFSNKFLKKGEKLFITNIINVTLKNLIYIDYLIKKSTKNIQKRKIKQLLRISVAQLFFMDSDNEGVVFEAGEISKKINLHQVGFVNATLKNIIKNKEKYDDEILDNGEEYIKYSYPKWIVNKLKSDFPESYLDIMKSYKEKSFLSVRFNKNKFDENTFNQLLKNINTEVEFQASDVYYLSNGNILETQEFKKGDIIIQDGSSYIASINLNCNENDTVLDACSAPGGKTLAILQNYFPKKMYSCDIHQHKIDILNKMKEKYNLNNLTVIKNDATQIENLNLKFDKILLDVPCSGIGVLRKKPEKIYNLSNENIKELKKLQKKIFDSAYNSLNYGGSIVYSTCTIIKNENTNNVEYFLNKYKNLQVEDVQIPENVEFDKDQFGGVLINHKNKYLDGFYIVKFRKEYKEESNEI